MFGYIKRILRNTLKLIIYVQLFLLMTYEVFAQKPEFSIILYSFEQIKHLV